MEIIFAKDTSRYNNANLRILLLIFTNTPLNPGFICYESADSFDLFYPDFLCYATPYGQVLHQIPSYYDLSGRAISWSDKTLLLYWTLGTLVVDRLLAFIVRRPHLHNYPFSVAEERRESLCSLFLLWSDFAPELYRINDCPYSVYAFSVERMPLFVPTLVILFPLASLVWGVRLVWRASTDRR